MATTSKKSGATDKFVNKAYATVTQAAANTEAYGEINFNIPTFDKVALIISKIEYHFATGLWAEMLTGSDQMLFGLTTNSSIGALTVANLSNPAVIDLNYITPVVVGAVVSMLYVRDPITIDYTSMPEGGIIVPPRPLYLYFDTAGFVAASTAYVILWFRYLGLSTEDYWDLVESTRVIQ